jgi:hypothetical protein
MKKELLFIVMLGLLFTFKPAEQAFSWDDKTHLAIAKKAGYSRWYNAAGADLAKIKAGNIEAYNHYSNNPSGIVITREMVIKQAEYYDVGDHREGHLYGAIIASVREYKKKKHEGKHAKPHLDYAVHYIGDLSQPLHNTVYNDFNKKNHMTIDLMIKPEQLTSENDIRIYPVNIKNEDDLAEKIANIANISIELGYLLEKENRILTKAEAMNQISHSSSLLKGLIEYIQHFDEIIKEE